MSLAGGSDTVLSSFMGWTKFESSKRRAFKFQPLQSSPIQDMLVARLMNLILPHCISALAGVRKSYPLFVICTC